MASSEPRPNINNRSSSTTAHAAAAAAASASTGSSSSKPKRTSISWTSPLVLLRAAILTLVLDGGCIAINTIQYPSLLLLHVLGSHALYRSYIRVTERLFGVVLVVVMSLLCPLEIVLTGDHRSLDATSRTLIMANHQIYTDWAYLWIVAWSKGAHGDIKIILKEDLKWIPVVGWGMQFFEFIFLARKWTIDAARLTSSLTLSLLSHHPLWMVIFPEGTVITDDTLAVSLAYKAKTPSLAAAPDPKHVLYPKTTGLRRCLEVLALGRNLDEKIVAGVRGKAGGSRGGGGGGGGALPLRTIDVLYDVCIAYEGGGAPGARYPFDRYPIVSVFVDGKGPRRVHMHFERVRVDNVPGLADSTHAGAENDQNDKFVQWTRQRFARKEAMLERFAQEGSFAAQTGADLAPTVVKVTPKIWDVLSLTATAVAAYYVWVWIARLSYSVLFGV